MVERVKSSLFPRYLYPLSTWQKLETPDLRTAVIIGYMKSGKSVLAEYVGARAFRSITRAGYDDDCFVFLEARSLRQARKWCEKNLDARTRFLMIFVDDALACAHSRQRNVEETTLFAESRHWSLRRGVITIMYATQNFKLLDSVMRYAHVYAWKTIPLEFYLESEAKKWVLKYIGLPEAVQALETITGMVYSLNPDEMLRGLRMAIVRIPIRKWGPYIYDEITPEKPPRLHYAWEDVEDDEGEGEVVNNNIDVKWARALARALIRLAQVTGASLRVNRQKYLVARVSRGGETKELSLGPIVNLLEELGVEWRRRGHVF